MTVESDIMSACGPLFIESAAGGKRGHRHNVPRDSETHFKVTLVTASFEGERSVDSINPCMQFWLVAFEPVHALALHTYTPEEWRGLVRRRSRRIAVEDQMTEGGAQQDRVVAALYQFGRLDDYADLKPLLRLCGEAGIKGTLLLAREGINGTIAGTRSNRFRDCMVAFRPATRGLGLERITSHRRTIP